MTVTFTPIEWPDVFLGIAVLPVSAFAILAAVFFLRETWKVVSGFYEKKRRAE